MEWVKYLSTSPHVKTPGDWDTPGRHTMTLSPDPRISKGVWSKTTTILVNVFRESRNDLPLQILLSVSEKNDRRTIVSRERFGESSLTTD